MQRPIDIICAGHFDLDIIPRFITTQRYSAINEFLIPGKMVEAGEAAVVPGGPVTNTGLSLHRLGVSVELMGKVGTDTFGKSLMGLIEEYEPNHRFRGFKVVDGIDTSYVIAIILPGIERIYVVNPGAGNTFGMDDINWDIAAQSKIFHIGYPPWLRKTYLNDGEELLAIFKRMKELGVTTSVDMSLPEEGTEAGMQDWEKILQRWAPWCDIMVPSVEETLYFLDRPKYNKMRSTLGPNEHLLDHLTPADIVPLGRRLIEFGVKTAMIKCGHFGLYICTAEKDRVREMGAAMPRDPDNWHRRQLWHPVYYVPGDEMVGSLGSGDSAIAGFFAAFIKNRSIEDCLRYANAAGSRNVTVSDGLSWNKGFEDLSRRIEEGWESEPFEISEKGWRRERELWVGPADSA